MTIVRPGRGMELAVSGDYVGYVVGGCCNVGELVYVGICKFGVYVVLNRAPICFVVVSVGTLGWRCYWTVLCVSDYE